MKTLSLIILLSFSAPAFASLEAREILNLPKDNFEQVLSEKGSKHAAEFKKLAFDGEQNLKTRWKALMAVAQIKKENSWGDLVEATKSSTWYMRNAGIVAMANLNPEKAKPFALKLLKDKALVVRSAAVDTFEKSMSVADRSALWKELNEKYNFKNQQSLWIRPQIVKLLGSAPIRSELPEFQGLLSDRDEKVRQFSIKALENLFGPQFASASTAQQAALWKNFIASLPAKVTK